MRAEWSAIVEELASEPRVLCHRDYHSRNLMLHDGSLYIIDFQDARMGPDTYDLASLLRDSYVDLTPQQVDELIAFFLALNGQADARPGVPAALRPDGAAAQPQGARHVRLHDDVAEQHGLYSVHPAYAGVREGEPREVPAIRTPAGPLIWSTDGCDASASPRISTSPIGSIAITSSRSPRTASRPSKCSRCAIISTTAIAAPRVALAEWLDDTRLRLHSMHAPIAGKYAGGSWKDGLSLAVGG